MSSGYTLRPIAEDDLADIWRFTAARWNVQQADRYYRGIISAFEALAREPTLGRACDDVRTGYRRHSVAAHAIFYRVDAAVVDIVRILHARRDFRRHLP